MHLIIAPSSLVYLTIISFEYALAFSYPFSVFTLILIPSQVKSDTQSISASSLENSLVAETILKKHSSYAMHLALRIYLAKVYIAVIYSFYALDSLN